MRMYKLFLGQNFLDIIPWVLYLKFLIKFKHIVVSNIIVIEKNNIVCTALVNETIYLNQYINQSFTNRLTPLI